MGPNRVKYGAAKGHAVSFCDSEQLYREAFVQKK